MFLQNNDLSRKVPHELDSEPTQSLRYSSGWFITLKSCFIYRHLFAIDLDISV